MPFPLYDGTQFVPGAHLAVGYFETKLALFDLDDVSPPKRGRVGAPAHAGALLDRASTAPSNRFGGGGRTRRREAPRTATGRGQPYSVLT